MFGNCDSKTNGEQLFFNQIKDKIETIFDVGCRSDTEFLDFQGEVHYFDPMTDFISKLSKMENKNKKSFFNNFGLSTESKTLYYYPKYQSFHDRKISCSSSDEQNKILLQVRKAKEYIEENNITKIDFLKIDTEGHELEILKGFEDKLSIVEIIQFEYGGTYLDSNIKLNDIISYLKTRNFNSFFLSN